MAKAVVCKRCGSTCHYQSFCPLNRKPVKKQSAKEIDYQEWKEFIARPFIIARDGNNCSCCGKFSHEKLDIDHGLTKGSRVDLKRDLDNLTLLCRYPCHRNKHDGKLCLH